LTGDGLKFLTINAQKAGGNNPSLVDIVTMLDQHSPDFLFLAETPMHPHSGALIHALRNIDYIIHHHMSNASFQPDGPTRKKWESSPDLGTWEMRSPRWDEWEGEKCGRSHFEIINSNLDEKNRKASGGLLNILWTTRTNMIML
jgi:hypothetical protein